MPIVFLLITTALISLLNYVPKTFLSGWDTLHPEFNLLINFQRVIFGVWRADQGLGAVPGHSAMSELPRFFLLSLFQLALPLSDIRYAYMFFCFAIGPIGIYLFLKRFVLRDTPPTVSTIAAFLGAFFYIFNLGTLQTFYVPFEMFPTQYAYLGWLFIFAFAYIEKPKLKYLVFFCITLFLASPMAYAAQLWYAFFMLFSVCLVGYALLSRKKIFKRSLLLLGVTLIINSYWLLPNLYYVKNYAQVPEQAKQNSVYSIEFFSQNQKYGTFQDTALLKNFYFNWTQYNPQTKQVVYLMPQWRDYVQQPWFLIIGYSLFTVVVLGAVLTLKRRKEIGIPFILSGSIAFAFIANKIPIIDPVISLLREHVSIFREALRFPFDKFVILLLFFYVIFFSRSIVEFLLLLQKISLKKVSIFTSMLFAAICSVLFIVYMFPIFQGQFIDPSMKITIPSSYFTLNSWLDKQNPNARILKLPMNTPTGWVYYAWGYQGSGFNWFGIPQPNLDRNSDRWYPYNEESYNEISYALYNQQSVTFEKLLKKYNIAYILVDTSVVAPGDKKGFQLFYPQTKTLLAKLSNIKLVKQMGKHIFVYAYIPNVQEKPVKIISQYQTVSPAFQWNFLDKAYMDYGDYITDLHSSMGTGTSYLGRTLFTPDYQLNKTLLHLTGTTYSLHFRPVDTQKGIVTMPQLSSTENEVYANVSATTTNKKPEIDITYSLPSVGLYNTYQHTFQVDPSTAFFSINNYAFRVPEVIKATQPLTSILTKSTSTNIFATYNAHGTKIQTNKTFSLSPHNCSTTSQASQSFGFSLIHNGFQLFNHNTKVCLSIPLSQIFPTILLQQDQLLQVSFSYAIQNTSKMNVCILDTVTGNCLENTQVNGNTTGTYTGLIPINQHNVSSLEIAMTMDTNQTNLTANTTITDFNGVLFPIVKKQTFSTDEEGYSIITNKFVLQGSLPETKHVDFGKLLAQKRDCSFTKAESIQKYMITTGNQQALKYETTDGTNCDEINLPTLSHSMGYIVHFRSAHRQGLPLRFCIMNTPNLRCMVEENLPTSNDFTDTYFLIPPGSHGYGYTMLISNISIDQPSINELTDIDITPFPYSYLQAINWAPMNQEIHTSTRATLQMLPGTIATDAFIVTPEEQGKQLVELNQAYEKNWKLYQVPSFVAKNPFFAYLAPLIGTQDTIHLLVNNWANGWEVHTAKATSYVAIFLPQYLEFFGLFLMLITFSIFFFRGTLLRFFKGKSIFKKKLIRSLIQRLHRRSTGL